MRIKYKDKSETFLENHLVSKEPFGQFKAWFDEACTRKEILEPNAMCLATATKYVTTCVILMNKKTITIIISRVLVGHHNFNVLFYFIEMDFLQQDLFC